MEDGKEEVFYYSGSKLTLKYKSTSSNSDFGFFAHISAIDFHELPILSHCENVTAKYNIQTFGNIDVINGYSREALTCRFVNFDKIQELEIFGDYFAIEKCCDTLKLNVSNQLNVTVTEGKSYFIKDSTQVQMYWHSDENIQGAGFNIGYLVHG